MKPKSQLQTPSSQLFLHAVHLSLTLNTFTPQEEFLEKVIPDQKNLARLLMSLGEALRTIAFKVRTASCGATACINTFGDEQLAVDLLADKLLFEVSAAARSILAVTTVACVQPPFL